MNAEERPYCPAHFVGAKFDVNVCPPFTMSTEMFSQHVVNFLEDYFYTRYAFDLYTALRGGEVTDVEWKSRTENAMGLYFNERFALIREPE